MINPIFELGDRKKVSIPTLEGATGSLYRQARPVHVIA
jgi:hypothetical protein